MGLRYLYFLCLSRYPSSQKTSVNLVHPEPERASRISANIYGTTESRGNTHTRNKAKEISSILSKRTMSCREIGPTKEKSHRGQNVSFKPSNANTPTSPLQPQSVMGTSSNLQAHD